jgi:RHS repeat-associated protein
VAAGFAFQAYSGGAGIWLVPESIGTAGGCSVSGYAQVFEEFNAQQLLAAMTQYGLDPISQFRSGAQSYYHMDGHSGVRLLTAGTGIVVSAVIYDAYGQLLRSVGNVVNPVLYRGERFDANLTQYYLRARFYDPSTGRFTKPDTLTANPVRPYGYAHADPLNYADPSGMLEFTVGGVLVSVSLRAYLVSAMVSFAVSKVFQAAWLLGTQGSLRQFEMFEWFDMLNLVPGVVFWKLKTPLSLLTKGAIKAGGKLVPTFFGTLRKYLPEIVKDFGDSFRGYWQILASSGKGFKLLQQISNIF